MSGIELQRGVREVNILGARSSILATFMSTIQIIHRIHPDPPMQLRGWFMSNQYELLRFRKFS